MRKYRFWVLGAGCWCLAVLALAAQPPSARQIFEQGQRAMDAGDLVTAEKDFRAVLAAEPDNVGAHGNLAVVDMRRKQWSAALLELQAAARLAPKVPGIRLNIGLVYYRQADYAHAIAPLASVLRDQPASTQARYLLGLCYFFTEHYADAAQTLEPLWESESANLNYLYVVSIAANKAGRPELDQRATARLIEVGRNSAEFHLIIGKAHLAHELYDGALDEFGQAARLDPKLPFVHYFLGAVYRRQNELETAKQEFLKDAAIEPDVTYNYDALGAVCYALNQIPEAERYFKEALRLDAGLGASDYGLAKIYKQEGKYREALELLRAAGDIDPKSASVYYLRGQILFATGRRGEAKSQFAEAARLKQATRDELERQISGQHPSDPQLAREDQ
ncbi:MAG TPA: tetratricopeptide repeat protein [Bryobacteraceae bacterium]|jgi:tetratricopeptide (TPR) repeat protein|nr:tetratricopeptide repeat protein [Bryobacteraceae bacterium]